MKTREPSLNVETETSPNLFLADSSVRNSTGFRNSDDIISPELFEGRNRELNTIREKGRREKLRPRRTECSKLLNPETRCRVYRMEQDDNELAPIVLDGVTDTRASCELDGHLSSLNQAEDEELVGIESARHDISAFDVHDQRGECSTGGSTSLSSKALTQELELLYECPFCSKKLADSTSQERTSHFNGCLESSKNLFKCEYLRSDSLVVLEDASAEKSKLASRLNMTKKAYWCLICQKDLSSKSFSSRVSHLRQCGKKNNLTVRGLAKLDLQAKSELPEDENSSNIDLEGHSSRSASIEFSDSNMHSAKSEIALNVQFSKSRYFDPLQDEPSSEEIVKFQRTLDGANFPQSSKPVQVRETVIGVPIPDTLPVPESTIEKCYRHEPDTLQSGHSPLLSVQTTSSSYLGEHVDRKKNVSYSDHTFYSKLSILDDLISNDDIDSSPPELSQHLNSRSRYSRCTSSSMRTSHDLDQLIEQQIELDLQLTGGLDTASGTKPLFHNEGSPKLNCPPTPSCSHRASAPVQPDKNCIKSPELPGRIDSTTAYEISEKVEHSKKKKLWESDEEKSELRDICTCALPSDFTCKLKKLFNNYHSLKNQLKVNYYASVGSLAIRRDREILELCESYNINVSFAMSEVFCENASSDIGRFNRSRQTTSDDPKKTDSLFVDRDDPGPSESINQNEDKAHQVDSGQSSDSQRPNYALFKKNDLQSLAIQYGLKPNNSKSVLIQQLNAIWNHQYSQHVSKNASSCANAGSKGAPVSSLGVALRERSSDSSKKKELSAKIAALVESDAELRSLIDSANLPAIQAYLRKKGVRCTRKGLSEGLQGFRTVINSR